MRFQPVCHIEASIFFRNHYYYSKQAYTPICSLLEYILFIIIIHITWHFRITIHIQSRVYRVYSSHEYTPGCICWIVSIKSKVILAKSCNTTEARTKEKRIVAGMRGMIADSGSCVLDLRVPGRSWSGLTIIIKSTVAALDFHGRTSISAPWCCITGRRLGDVRVQIELSKR